MRTFIPRKMMLVTMMALLFAAVPAMAQKAGKISPATRMIIADRDGKLSLETPQNLQVQVLTTLNKGGNQTLETTTIDNIQPFAKPFTRNGKQVVQCWIEMGNGDYAALERLGVEILCKFKDRVTANIPVDAIERVAAIVTVSKVSVAKKLQKKTYVARQMTNVDDLLNYSSDAQGAGLLQAYDGTGVVLGVIDTGIDFSHPMFGSDRIKKKYVFNTTTEQLEEYTGTAAYYTSSTHGTHTSTIAGGSDYTTTAYVYGNSTSYTTVNNAKFGGMAPGTDLVLCDLGEELTDANIAACIKLISDYADEVGKPCVTSLSLGGHYGPHDGTGNMADICAQYTGPGKLIVFAAGNEGDENIYHYKEASSSSPAMSLLSAQTRSSDDYDLGEVISYARTPNVELAARYYVVNTRNNSVVWTSNEITTDDYFVDDEGNIELYGAEISVNDTGSDGTTKLSNYFTAYQNNTNKYGYLCCYMDKDSHNNKWNVVTLLYYLVPNNNNNSNYMIGMSVYPKTGTSYVDSWPVAYIDFTASSASVNGNSFTAGTNECSISDETTYPSVISVGSYVSSKYYYGLNYWGNSGSRQQWTSNPTWTDISSFSSYQSQGSGPLGTKLPWITAPGEVIIAGYNSGYTPSDNTYYAYGTNHELGAMGGTSMAAPCVAGICALWLQAEPSLTPAQIKELMAQTAVKDNYVTGTNASHFGNGKIDALAGIQELLRGKTLIKATPQTITMSTKVGQSVTQTVNVRGANLSTNIYFTLNDANNVFSINKAYVTRATAESDNGAEFTITFSPTIEGEFSATVTLSSTGAEDVVVYINGTSNNGGTAVDAYLDIAKYATIDGAGYNKSYVNPLYNYDDVTYKSDNVAWLTLPVYGAFSSVYYSPKAQKWIKTSLISTGDRYINSTTWDSQDIHKGSNTYFSGLTAYTVYGSSNSSTPRTVTFYVTNTTAVKLLGKNSSSNQQSSYPSKLNIYVCTDNGDGTLNESTNDIANQSNGTKNAIFNLAKTGLDATKIYKVVASVTRGWLYEIGFQTPLKSAEITADPTSLAFETYVNEPVSKTFNVKGTELEGDITATLTDANDVFSINPSSITVAEASSGTGKDITVTFSPTAVGNYSGTITLTSTGADPVTVTLNGKAVAPSLTANPDELTFNADPGATTGTQTDTKSFTISGEYLKGAVAATLTDENGVFSIDKTTITKAEAEAGATVNVTFNPSTMGIYEGKVTLTSDGVEDVVVNLTGYASFKVTIGEYGLTTLYVDQPLLIPYDKYDPDLLGVYYAWGIEVKQGDKTQEIKLKRLDNDIPKETAVVVQGNSGTYFFPINMETPSSLKYESLLKGSLTRTPTAEVQAQYSDATVMTLGKGSSGYVGFYRYKGTYLNANKAYLIYTGSSSVNGFTFGFGGDETGIVEAGISATDGPWYTIQGMRLEGHPRQRGIYIHNGKTVVVK